MRRPSRSKAGARHREKALGPEHPDTATSLNNLAVLYWAQAHWSEAAGSLRRAAQARESLAQNILVIGR